jgi:Cu2+-exporting ATPase
MQARIGLPPNPVPQGATDGVCFHCGLPAAPDDLRTAAIDGVVRTFCCPGCEAVAQAIVGQGLGDYYRFRESAPERPVAGDDAEFLVYDEPAAQAGFVTAGPGDEREAALLLEGIRCAACIWLSEQTLARLPGVVSAQVNYATRRARVRWRAGEIALSRILAAVAAIGYRAFPFEPGRADEMHRREQRGAFWRLFVAGFGMMQVMMYAVPVYLAEAGTMTADIEQLMRWASLALTLPVVLYSSAPFFQGALRDLRAGRLGMDVPVALGVAVAFAASLWATVAGTGEVYFDSVTMFVFLLLGGRYLELRARQRAGAALDHLMRLAPEVCSRVVDIDALTVDRVAVATLVAGDLVLVKPGETVPADGVIERGQGALNESLLTGESVPVRRAPGEEVVGGAINAGDPLVVRVTRVGGDTVLAGIVRLVERATLEKQRIVELADRYAHWFVLAVLALAAAAAAGWAAVEPAKALWIAVSVLVVTCPCALSLATPVALTAATGELARHGFVVTRGHAIETLARATDFVFDKTGTLTEGQLHVGAIELGGPLGEDECLAIAAALERGSEHPVARAILARAGAAAGQLHVTNVAATPGSGIEALVEGVRYRIGTPAFCGASDEGRSEVVLASAGRLVARFTLQDRLREDAPALIRSLVAAGRRVHLLSGDAVAAVDVVGDSLGIERRRSRASPEAKQAYLRELQREGRVVAMVGDGINDAPVLALADVSVAMASGAHLAQARADAVLVSNRLSDLAGAVGLTRKAIRIVRENLMWATLYNAVAIPAAVAGLVTPWIAGIGMSGSSLAVVLNALRLRRPEAERRAPPQVAH